MAQGPRERFFGALAGLGIGRPVWVLVVTCLLMIGGAVLLPGLKVSTSRTGLVSNDDPQQARLNTFYERFGRPDAPVFVITGGTEEDRRGVVDRLERELATDERFAGRVIGHLDPADIASVLLLQQPQALAELRATMGPADLPSMIEGGLPLWLQTVHDQLDAGLSGEAAPGADPGADQELDPKQIDENLARLATMAELLSDTLAGRDALARFSDMVPVREGVDSAGYLMTVDGQAHLVTVFPELDTDEGLDLKPIVEDLRAMRDRALQAAPVPDDLRADLTGLPALSVDELASVQSGLRVSSIAATIGIFVLCLALFRSLRQTIVALLPLLPGTLLTLVVVRLLYGHLNLITSSFVAVLLGLGIDFSVHLIARQNEEIRQGKPVDRAIRAALVHTGPGIMTGALVTAAAFLTTATVDFTAYAELGVVTAFGLVIIMFATFFLLPPLLSMGRGGSTPRMPPEPPGLPRIPALVRKARWVIVALGIGLGVAGAFALPKIAFNPRYFDFLPSETESARPLEVLEYDPIASPIFASLTAETVEDARALTAELRALESVAGVQSPTDLLPELTAERLADLRRGFAGLTRAPDFAALAGVKTDAKALATTSKDIADLLDSARFELERAGLPSQGASKAGAAFAGLAKQLGELDDAGATRLSELHASLARLLEPAWTTARQVAERGAYAPADLPELFQRRFMSKAGDALALFVVPSGAFWEVDVSQKFTADILAVDPDAAGMALTHVAHGEMIREGFQRAALISAALIIVMLLVDLRSVVDSMLALLPTVLGWLWMLGLLGALGLTFNNANIVALPLVLGIGIAFGVHMMHRCREVTRRAERADQELDEIIRGTGGAILIAALTTMVGFAGLMLGEYRAMQSLGLVMVLGIGTCLLATMIVLPATLLIVRRAR